MKSEKKRRFRDITQRYCAEIDDNVPVERHRIGDHDEFICITHPCGRGECDRFLLTGVVDELSGGGRADSGDEKDRQ